MYLKTISILGFACTLAAAPAVAGDLAYADHRGNLIVESDAGYKRILVGQAGNARELSRYLSQAQGYADGLGATRLSPDSQGNLTIRAASGYKHIIVNGADEIEAAAQHIRASRDGRYDPAADFYSDRAGHTVPVVCAGPDGIIKGRSYMYGLDRNETPVILTCE